MRRKRPRVGDRKTVRGVTYVRQLQRVRDPRAPGAINKTGGRYHYEWVPLENVT